MLNRVLVVEASKNIGFMIEKCLVKHGYRVERAGDGIEAMSKIFELEPELILLDMLVPKLNGLMICEAIRSSPKVSSIPIIAMTSMSHEEDIERILQSGAEECLIKPFTPQDLITRVKKYLVGM